MKLVLPSGTTTEERGVGVGPQPDGGDGTRGGGGLLDKS